MKIIKQSIGLLFCLFVICLHGYAFSPKKILILNSYHSGLSWTDSIVSSIKHEFADDLSCSIFIEDMDSKRNFSEKYLDFLKRTYKEKYQEKTFDLIISTDNNAYDFLLKYRDEVFGEVPVLFCGFNGDIIPPKGYSGVFENLDFCSTIHLIEQNHPNYSEIVVFSDFSTTGKSIINYLEKDISDMNHPIRIKIIQALTIEDLKSKMTSLDKQSVVLYLLFNRDSEGNYYTYESSFKEVQRFCNVPIYCVWDFYLNKGAVGGALMIGRDQGKQVSEMAKKVLAGTPIDDIPTMKAQYKYVFDNNQLNRFHIQRNKLPENSKIINIPYSFIRENKDIVILTLTVLILLTIIIIVMTINIHLRKVKAQKEKIHLQEIKRNQKKLKKAKEKAEESSRLKSAFLANMSHEIRTPMNAILGFTELLSRDDVEREKRVRFIGIIQKNTKNLLHLINDILDISKIETNQLKIVKTRIKLLDLFETLRLNYESLIAQQEDKKLQLIITLPEDSQILEINTDSIRLQQIFNNLIENSIKFTITGEIEIGYEIIDKSLLFFVRDTGIGIPENRHEVIFDRFRQADLDANTRQYGGTGLGLAISKSLVEMLGGKIWIKSVVNEGTIFYFSIPL